MRRLVGICLTVIVSAAAGTACAGDSAKQNSQAESPAALPTLNVAVLDFEATDPTNATLGEDIAAALTAMLSDQPGITLVERRSLTNALREHELNLTGVADSRQAVKLGKLVGAQIIINGRAFRLGKEIFITARLIGTNTSLMEGVLIKDAGDADLGALAEKLATKVAEKLHAAGPKLIDRPELPDPLPELKKKLAGRRLPVVAVVFHEEHHGSIPEKQSPEGKVPAGVGTAAETEIKRLLIECGFTVRELPQPLRATLTKDGKPLDPKSWPAGLKGVDILITGEAFGEYAARIGNLVSCTSRAEGTVLLRDGTLLQAARVVQRGADLSENIAAKKALQNAGRDLGIEIVARLAEKLPKK